MCISIHFLSACPQLNAKRKWRSNTWRAPYRVIATSTASRLQDSTWHLSYWLFIYSFTYLFIYSFIYLFINIIITIVTIFIIIITIIIVITIFLFILFTYLFFGVGWGWGGGLLRINSCSASVWFIPIHASGPPLPSCKTSFPSISWSIEAVKLCLNISQANRFAIW